MRHQLRGRSVHARVTADGDFVVTDGKVELRYALPAGKPYFAYPGNLKPMADAGPILPDSAAAPAPEAGITDTGSATGSATPQAPAKSPPRKATPKAAARSHKGPWCVAYADGSALGNPGPSGLGVVLQAGAQETEIAEHLGRGTNNQAELMAILRAAEKADDLGLALELHTDSQYAIGVLTKNWKPKVNQVLIAQVKEALARLPAFSLHYVRGHAGHPLNERADTLARDAAALRR